MIWVCLKIDADWGNYPDNSGNFIIFEQIIDDQSSQWMEYDGQYPIFRQSDTFGQVSWNEQTRSTGWQADVAKNTTEY